MKKVLSFIKEMVVDAWESEPALITGVVASGVVAALTLVGLSVPLTTVTTVVTVAIAALVTRLKVTPVAKVVPTVPPVVPPEIPVT